MRKIELAAQTKHSTKKIFPCVILALILINTLTMVFSTQPVKATDGTIYIRADGSIDPPTAPIKRNGNLYTFTADIYGSIVVERDNIVIDGAGYTLQKTEAYRSKGIDLSRRTNVTVRNTQIKNFDWGICLDSSSKNIISGNNITNNNIDGVELAYSSSNCISGNNITANHAYGVLLFSSSNNSINGNDITNNHNGIWLQYSSNNWFYHNSFINNGVQVFSYSSGNVWDDEYPSGGNYWSDYTGVDFYWGPDQNQPGSDGIGDTPYVIDANNRDRYPLMKPWSPGSVKKEVRFRGTVTGFPDFDDMFGVDGVNVRVDEIFDDPTLKLEIGDTATVTWVIYPCPPYPEEKFAVGDQVDVCGYYETEEKPDWWSKTGEHWIGLGAPNHYIRKAAEGGLIDISLSSSAVSVNQPISISGSLTPPITTSITLTFTKPDGSLVTSLVTTDASGKFTYQFTPDQEGTWNVQASWEGNEQYFPAKSDVLSFEVTTAVLPPLTSAQISSFTVSKGRADRGDAIYFTFQIKNTGSSKGWAWPFVMIVGPFIEEYTFVGKVIGSPLLAEPGQTLAITEWWTVPPDAPAGDYVAVGYVFDQDPAIASSKSLDSKGSWFMIGGASFLQVEGSKNNRLIHVHVEPPDIVKLRGMVGGIDLISLNQLLIVLKSSGLPADITDDDIAGVFLSYYITLPKSGSLDITIIQQSERLGRIYEGTYSEAHDKAAEEFLEGLVSAIPVGGDIIDILNTVRELGPIAGLLKIVVFVGDMVFDTYAGLLLTAIESFTSEVNLGQALATVSVPAYFSLQIPDLLLIEEIGPAGRTCGPRGNVNITARVSDATGQPVSGARAYWIHTTGANEHGRMTEGPNGVYSVQLKAPILPGIYLLMLSVAKPGVGVGFQAVQLAVSWFGTEIILQETRHKLYLHVYDNQSRHVGVNYDTGEVEIGIPGSYYYDNQNGTLIVLLPNDVSVFRVCVDAQYAEEKNEWYNLTISTVSDTQIVDQKNVQAVVEKGSIIEYEGKVSSDGKVIITPYLPPWWSQYWYAFVVVVAVLMVSVIFLVIRKKPSRGMLQNVRGEGAK